MSDIPSAEQVLQIEPTTELEVPEDYLDSNGHVNIRHYFDLCAASILDRWRELRGDPPGEARNLSLFTAEHHLRYLHELRLGQRLSVHVRMIEHSDRVAHSMALLVNRSTMRLAYTFEATVVHMDLETRRSAPFPDKLAAQLDAEIGRLGELDWAAPVCGAMGIRRK